jgi:hypothetical protein
MAHGEGKNQSRAIEKGIGTTYQDSDSYMGKATKNQQLIDVNSNY